MLRQMYIQYKQHSNYAVDLDFIGFVLKAFKALSKVSVTFWLLYGWSEDKSLWKLFSILLQVWNVQLP